MEVVSTKTPNPAVKIVVPQSVIVTLEPDILVKVESGIVQVPLLGV